MAHEIEKANIIRRYNNGTATHNYIFGFVRNNQIYAVEIRNAQDLLISLTSCEIRSKVGATVRYAPTRKQQEIILANAHRVEILGTFDFMESDKVNHKNNRGNWFEDMATSRWNGTQPKNPNAPFTQCGDFNANGIEYQCKFGCSKGKATFTNEKTLKDFGL